MSSECSDKLDVLCLEYFRAQQAVKVANAIVGYVTSTNTTTSAIAGIQMIKVHLVHSSGFKFNVSFTNIT